MRTVPLRAVTPQPWAPPGHPAPSAPPPAHGSSPPPEPQGHALAGTVVMQAAPILQPPAPPPPAPPPPAPRQMIEEAPFVEMPTRVAMMSDWPTDHPANDVFRNRPPATRRDRNGGRTLVIAFGVALGVGGIAAGVFFGLRHASASKPKPSASATVESTNDAPPSVVMPEPSVTAAAPSASSTQLVSASSAAVETAPDLSKLLSYEAYLTVSSSSDAEVLVQGVLAGRTNERLLVRCGSRNVRLRKSDGTWLTKGEALKVPCMKATTLRVDAP